MTVTLIVSVASALVPSLGGLGCRSPHFGMSDVLTGGPNSVTHGESFRDVGHDRESAVVGLEVTSAPHLHESFDLLLPRRARHPGRSRAPDRW